MIAPARWRRARAALAVLVALALAACSGLPTAGPVRQGGGEAVAPGDFIVLGPTPQVGDTPVDIVSGFIRASAAGVSGTFSEARAFLTPSAARTWDPDAAVTVFGTEDVGVTWDELNSTVTYSIPVQATVGPNGEFTEADYRKEISFGLTVDTQGQWRISEVDDGIVLSGALFDALYRPVALHFASQDGRYVVPELRWLPEANAATRAAEALIAGPSPWLADSVMTGIPANARLSPASVAVVDGVATVALAPGGVGSADERALALEQFRGTLGLLPGVSSVEVTVAGVSLSEPAAPSLANPPVPTPAAVAFVGDRLALLGPDGLVAADPSLGALPSGAHAPALAWDGTTVAFLVGSGTLVSTDALSIGTVPLGESTPAATGTLTTSPRVQGADLVAPTFDRHGWLWTAERDNAGVLLAAGPGGETVAVDARWLAGRDVGAIRVAPDGARVAIVSREGSVWRLEVAGVVRDGEGGPLALGEPLSLNALPGPESGVVWIDELTLASLGGAADGDVPEVSIVTIGGLGHAVPAVGLAVGLAGRYAEASLILVTSEGELFQRSTTGWSALATALPLRGLAFSG